MELNKPQARWKETQIRSEDPALVVRPIPGRVDPLSDGRPRRSVAVCSLISIPRPGRSWLIIVLGAPCCSPIAWTGPPNKWSPAIPASKQIERVFRGLKDGDWLGWGPMYHWTDRKIRIHAFYCMLGYLAVAVCAPPGAERLERNLRSSNFSRSCEQIQQFGSSTLLHVGCSNSKLP